MKIHGVGKMTAVVQLWRLIYRHRMKEYLFSQAKALVTKSFYNPTGYAQALLLCTIVSKSVKSLEGQEAPPGLLTSIPGLLGSQQGPRLQLTPEYWK